MKIKTLINKITTLVVILPGLAILASPVGAHTGGFTYEANVNNYFVDIGASKLEIVPNELTLFEFNLYPNTDPNNLADFDSVYVTIGDETAVQVSTFVHRPQDMLTVLSYSFPKSGKYEMSARFQKGTTQLAEVSFPVEVGSGGGGISENSIKIIIFAAIVITAVIATIVIKRRRGHLNNPPLTDK